MVQERVDALLAAIATRTGLPVARDGNGSCAIRYGEGFELALTALGLGEEVLLHAPVQFAHPDDPAGQFRRCLEFSLYGSRSQGASVGLDSDGWITLWRRLSVEGIDDQGLEDEIVSFAAAAYALRSELAPGQFGEVIGAAFAPEPGYVVIKA
ncbi:MAG TPA: type III secretion system chaperone [Steroidobacteraceae bacterium]|nr:type III secretion system chaperone [Steroidobacteraceae bacterium]